ncbi:MAG: hypothetical protein JJE22_04275, partial [Bacteroidia bacterium]|nr:hypothetical protein [Bacteroidia bacterium]
MKLFVLSFFVFILIACNEAEKAVQVKDKFDAIEKIVGTANWELVDGQDTSYLYFSRIGEALFKAYHFRIERGDTVNTIMNTITARQDTVIWNWRNLKLLLTDVTDNNITWETINTEKEKYVLNKTDSLHISFVLPGGYETKMKRTLP